MPLQLSQAKLLSVVESYGYKGSLEDLGLERLVDYVRKYYGLKDSWRFRGLERKNAEGGNILVYNFAPDGAGARVLAE